MVAALLLTAFALLLPLNVAAAPGAERPPLGYSNWNGFHNRINTSLFLETAQFMKSSGLLDAGYDLVTLGGIGYANGSTFPDSASGWGPAGPGNITRNASGHLQVDPVRFPGGNEGMRKLTDAVRALGFRWGHYTESGTSGCNGAHGSSEGYEQQDAALFFEDFRSEYLMVDSCGIEPREPPHGPPKDWPLCPSNSPGCGPRAAQAQWEMTTWRELIDSYVSNHTVPAVILHDCHNGCGSPFGGPTLAAVPCNESDPAQHWSLPLDGSVGGLTSAANGLCLGCASSPVPDTHRAVNGTACANDAETKDGGSGLGMQACLLGPSDNGVLDSKAVRGYGIGSNQQLWNYSSSTATITQKQCGPQGNACSGVACLSLANAVGPAVVKTKGGSDACSNASSQWTAKPVTGSGSSLHQFASVAAPSMCLSSNGEVVKPPVDPWCISNNNMWRSNTDTLQSWTRVMVEVESMANQGHISRPGAWSFPDCLEIGTPGSSSLTWEESKANLALFAVTSSPLLLGNDPREGRMQKRLVSLVSNPDMLAVDQYYSTEHAYAGGRIATWPVGRELWAKPLANETVAVVLFNRAGSAIGQTTEGAGPLPPHCTDPESTLAPCTGCFLDGDQPWTAPCDDNATASSGAQELTLSLDQLPDEWLSAEAVGDPSTGAAREPFDCDVFDIFATAGKGAAIGRTAGGSWSAIVPPHGVRFLRLSNCH